MAGKKVSAKKRAKVTSVSKKTGKKAVKKAVTAKAKKETSPTVAPKTPVAAKAKAPKARVAAEKEKPTEVAKPTPQALMAIKQAAPKKPKANLRKVAKAQLQAEDRLGKKWESLQKRSKGMVVATYNMRKTYQANTAIEHKVLGWGYILDNKNDRLEVLFKDGIKYLISNYKA